MSGLRNIDKKILESYFGMSDGYVLNFSTPAMEKYFLEEFNIHIYDAKYDTPDRTSSKANRLRGIWREESDDVVGKIILSLVEYDDTMQEINPNYTNPHKNLKQKIEAIAQKLLGTTIKSEPKKGGNYMPAKDTHQKRTNMARFPHKIPAGTEWSQITMAFEDDEHVSIQVRGLEENLSYKAMGFSDERNGKPNTQWELLKIFAKNNGSLRSASPDSKDKYKKQKQLLSDKLKSYFSIDYDPFESYGVKSGYVLKMTIFYKKYDVEDQIKNNTDPFADIGEHMRKITS